MSDVNNLIQSPCLLATNGREWMKEYFDRFPPAVREALRNSPFNICSACLKDVSNSIQNDHYTSYGDWMEREEALMRAIEKIENKIRCIPA